MSTHETYSIVDAQGVDYGTLQYNATDKTWHIRINPARTWDDTPISLATYIQQGIYDLDARQSLGWVQDRLLPPNRQNIYHILQSEGMSEYDEHAFLQITEGHCPNDSLFLVRQQTP
jgi:hypothetical protein